MVSARSAGANERGSRRSPYFVTPEFTSRGRYGSLEDEPQAELSASLVGALTAQVVL